MTQSASGTSGLPGNDSGPQKRRLWKKRQDSTCEVGEWELREAMLATISELEAKLRGIPNAKPELRKDIEAELQRAREKVDRRQRPKRLASSRLTVALVHVNAARAMMLRLVAVEEVTPLLPGLIGLIREHLDKRDPRRVAVENIWKTGKTPTCADVELIADAVGTARLEALREQLRVGSFVRIVRFVAAGLGFAAVGIAVIGLFWPQFVPLCFAPQTPTGHSGTGFTIVCPVGSNAAPTTTDVDHAMAATASRADYLSVEIVGLVAAGIAAATALRRINGTSTPYPVPVSLAWLKLPTGALTAVLGLVLMRGGFVPGLSALDSSAQIIAWAVIFGYSQQLFTKFVDKQGQAVLDSVRGPATAASATTASDDAATA